MYLNLLQFQLLKVNIQFLIILNLQEANWTYFGWRESIFFSRSQHEYHFCYMLKLLINKIFCFVFNYQVEIQESHLDFHFDIWNFGWRKLFITNRDLCVTYEFLIDGDQTDEAGIPTQNNDFESNK